MAEEIGSAYLTIKPKIDDGFESDVKNHGSVGGSKFGGAFAVAAGSLIASGIEKAISGAFSLLGDAFSNYSNFEQLSGGVEKIFDQANIAGIMKDAQDAYKNLNMSANEYLESINQTGAAFAQTMGDQKGYDTAKQGMQAIADYASGTGRNVSELNDKFAMITRATSSYQSIADQFSGILPATSADFLAQAQAAGFLGTQYTKLTEVPIAEYQQAVSAMLEKGVGDMGLLGNTAAESTETISGSLAMLQSSWTNFTTELGKDSADMPARTGELVDSIVAVVENIAPRLLAFAENLFAAIPTLIEKIQPYIDQFVQMASAFIEEHQPEIQAAGETMFEGIKNALGVVAELAIQALIELIGHLIETFPEWYPQVQEAAFQLFMEVVSGFANGLQPFMEQVNSLIQSGLDGIGSFFSNFLSAGGKIIDNIVKGISGGIDTVRKVFDDVVYAITHPLETAQETVENIVNTIENLFNNMQIDIPSFRLPEINWHWESVGGVLDIPVFDGISWFAKGGFADEATLAGYGERGLELYWPGYSPYFEKYAKGIAEHMPASGVDIHDCTFNIRKESDIRAVAVELNTLINRQTAGGIA